VATKTPPWYGDSAVCQHANFFAEGSVDDYGRWINDALGISLVPTFIAMKLR